MATVSIVFGPRASDDVGAMKTRERDSETIASTGASQTSVGAAQSSEYIEVTALGNVWIKFGTAPTAVAGDGYLLPAGVPRQFKAEAGDKVAVIDAA